MSFSTTRRLVLLAASLGAATLWLLGSGAGAQAEEPATAPSVKIMPLGASLTYGTGSSTGNGYREDLRQQLTSAGVSIDYVGSLKSGDTDDPENEGHGGYRIDQIAANADGWLTTYRPDVVLLAVGANDVLQDYDLQNAPVRLSSLIDEILTARPGVTLMVSTLQPLAKATDNAQVNEYNEATRALVEQKVEAGDMGLHLVDLNAVLTMEDLNQDGIHPTDAGYTKIANAWFQGLEPILSMSSD